jgi:hypothetical protein
MRRIVWRKEHRIGCGIRLSWWSQKNGPSAGTRGRRVCLHPMPVGIPTWHIKLQIRGLFPAFPMIEFSPRRSRSPERRLLRMAPPFDPHRAEKVDRWKIGADTRARRSTNRPIFPSKDQARAVEYATFLPTGRRLMFQIHPMFLTGFS